jgi:hypothetical protein
MATPPDSLPDDAKAARRFCSWDGGWRFCRGRRRARLADRHRSFCRFRSTRRGWSNISRRRLNRRTDDSCARGQSPVHSARVGNDVEVHYRWHALYGQRVALHHNEVRAGAWLSYVEASPGVVIVLPSWMLDPVACADMALGAPRVDVGALKDLSHLLVDRGFRRSSPGDVRVAKEEQNEGFAQARRKSVATVGRSAPTHDRVRAAAVLDDARDERRRIVLCLANLLIQAASGVPEEDRDDER